MVNAGGGVRTTVGHSFNVTAESSLTACSASRFNPQTETAPSKNPNITHDDAFDILDGDKG
ncbi:MAG: hypothetical protein EXS40_03375 [Opitutaceae bacterium]|nr:hypothetical protein [Opitutaceae bacterium]